MANWVSGEFSVGTTAQSDEVPQIRLVVWRQGSIPTLSWDVILTLDSLSRVLVLKLEELVLIRLLHYRCLYDTMALSAIVSLSLSPLHSSILALEILDSNTIPPFAKDKWASWCHCEKHDWFFLIDCYRHLLTPCNIMHQKILQRSWWWSATLMFRRSDESKRWPSRHFLPTPVVSSDCVLDSV